MDEPKHQPDGTQGATPLLRGLGKDVWLDVDAVSYVEHGAYDVGLSGLTH